MERLDLRPDGVRSPDEARALSRIALAIREEFIAVIDGVTRDLAGRPDWLYTAPASRNPLTSDLFFRCAGLALLEERLAAGDAPRRVLTDSPAFARGLSRWPAAQKAACRAEIPAQGKGRLQAGTRLARTVLGQLLWQLLLVRAARRAGPPRPLPAAPLTLVDTFLDKDRPLADRYFPGLLDCLDEEEARRVRVVPTIYGQGLSGFRAMFATLRDGAFLFKEDYLTYGDCLASCAGALATRRLAVPPALFRGFDLAPLIREELRQCRDFAGTAGALLNRAFVGRLKRAGVAVARLVSWFENQPVDKGLNQGLAREYPDAARLGYQGFVPPPLHLSQFCTEGERRAMALPDTVAVMGPGLLEAAGTFCPALRYMVAPAFRFAYLHMARPRQDRAVPRILAALPLNLPDAVMILDLILGASPDAPPGTEILVKAHPACPATALLREWKREPPAAWKWVAQPMAELLPQCGLVVSVASSVCAEAAALGVPVAVVAGGRGLPLNPLPESLRDGMWKPCLTAGDLAVAIDAFLGPQAPAPHIFREAAREYLQASFAPPSRARARVLLGFEAAP